MSGGPDGEKHTLGFFTVLIFRLFFFLNDVTEGLISL